MNDNISKLLNTDSIKLLFSIFKKDDASIRLVGGSIRDALINRETKDIDTATKIEPKKVINLLL